MNISSKVIRDFLYLDNERLYSLSSQVHEGVVAHIAESFQSEQSRKDVQRAFLGKNIDEKVAEAALRTENKLLYDHLYSQLESGLAEVIVDPTRLVRPDYPDLIDKGVFIKVRGSAVVDDYKRLAAFLNGFNELGAGIAYVSTFQSGEIESARLDLEARKADLKAKLQSSKNPLERSELKNQIGALESLEQPTKFFQAFAATKGLYQDPVFLSGLKIMLEMFRPNTYEISITPSPSDEARTFRSVLDRRWLRTDPEYLRSLYGGSAIATNLVMVGQLTSLLNTGEAISAAEAISAETAGEESIKDVSHKMFRIMSVLDEMMTASKQKPEILVHPLAIYKEIIVPAS